MGQLVGMARFQFRDGDVEEFKRLSAEAMEIVRAKDTGTLQYDVYFNEDESECVVLERFRDSDALLEHAANLADLMEPIIATGTVTGLLLGDPSPELRARFSDDGVVRLFGTYLSMQDDEGGSR